MGTRTRGLVARIRSWLAPDPAVDAGTEGVELLAVLRRHRRQLALGGILGALLLGVPRFLRPRTYTCRAVLLFPAAPRAGALRALTGGGATDMPSLPLMEGLLSIPQPGSSPETAKLILGSQRATMALVRRLGLAEKWELPPEKARRKLGKALELKVGDTGDLGISFAHPEPELAVAVVQSTIDQLTRSIEELKLDPAAQSVAFIRKELASSEAAFARASEALVRFQRENGNLPPDTLVQHLGSQYGQLQTSLVTAEVEANTTAARARNLTSAAEAMLRAAQDPTGNPESLLGQLYENVVTQELKLSVLRRKYADEHTEVVAAQQQLEQAREALQQEVQRQLAGLGQGQSPFVGDAVVAAAVAQAKVDGLRQAVAKLRRQLDRVPERQARHAHLLLDLETQKARVVALRAELVKAQLFADRTGPRFVVVDPPVKPVLPNPRGALRMALLGFILGVMGTSLALKSLRTALLRLGSASPDEEPYLLMSRPAGYNYYNGSGRRAPRRRLHHPPKGSPQQALVREEP